MLALVTPDKPVEMNWMSVPLEPTHVVETQFAPTQSGLSLALVVLATLETQPTVPLAQVSLCSNHPFIHISLTKNQTKNKQTNFLWQGNDIWAQPSAWESCCVYELPGCLASRWFVFSIPST